VNYEEWQAGVPACITGDTIWRVEAYRLSLFLSDLAWCDVSTLMKDGRTREAAGQLHRSVGKISACITEGYSRGTGRGRAVFYEYALGSVRETRDWYFKSRHVLGEEVTMHRLELCTRIAKLTTTMVRRDRSAGRQFEAGGGT
jgi:four helix bundle protein